MLSSHNSSFHILSTAHLHLHLSFYKPRFPTSLHDVLLLHSTQYSTYSTTYICTTHHVHSPVSILFFNSIQPPPFSILYTHVLLSTYLLLIHHAQFTMHSNPSPPSIPLLYNTCTYTLSSRPVIHPPCCPLHSSFFTVPILCTLFYKL